MAKSAIEKQLRTVPLVSETALLLDQPRNATVAPTTDMTGGVIERNDFRRLHRDHPDLHAPLLDAMAKRLA